MSGTWRIIIATSFFLVFGIGIVRFENGVCNSSNYLDGTCYTRAQCRSVSGYASGRCASNIGVCCVSKLYNVILYILRGYFHQYLRNEKRKQLNTWSIRYYFSNIQQRFDGLSQNIKLTQSRYYKSYFNRLFSSTIYLWRHFII